MRLKGINMAHQNLQWPVLCCVFLALGCARQQYGECPPPNQDLQILYKAKVGANPLSHSFCVVCKPSLAPEEYAEWGQEMGAVAESRAETPCLYVYGDRDSSPEGYGSLEQCLSAVCDGHGSYSDFVSRRNENIDLDPLIGPVDEE